MTDTLEQRRARALARLRLAHSRQLPLEIAERELQELTTALAKRLEIARRRLGNTGVTREELLSHQEAALRLGEAERRLLRVVNQRRALNREIAGRTDKLARPRKLTK